MTGDPEPELLDFASRIVMVVNDMGSVKAADDFIVNTSKKVYSKDGQAVTVDGAEGYFGTDGAALASVSFTRGRFVFEVLVTTSGQAPKNLKDIAMNAAAAYPDTQP